MTINFGQASRRLMYVLCLLGTIGFVGFASAVFVEERLDDPVKEERVRDIAEGIRCLVCQNQSILDSNAGLARDLRAIVRERILAGDTDDQVQNYLVSRYGDWVLLNPPFKMRTLVLWLSPMLVLLFGGFLVVRFLRRKSAAPTENSVSRPLTDAEKKTFDQLMAEDDGERGRS